MIYYIQCHANWKIKSLYYKVPFHFSKPFGSRCYMNHECTGRMVWNFAPACAPVDKLIRLIESLDLFLYETNKMLPHYLWKTRGTIPSLYSMSPS